MDMSFDFFAALKRMVERRKANAAPSPAASGQTPLADVQTGPGDASSIGPQGLALIKRFEGCARRRSDGRFEAYPDPGTGADPWTIGWGATGRDVAKGLVWTQAQCDARLEQDLARFAREVRHAIGNSPTTPAQFDALVSFHYNTGAIARATLTRLHRRGDFSGAAAEFGKWVHAGGKRLAGLVRRREAEAALYLAS